MMFARSPALRRLNPTVNEVAPVALASDRTFSEVFSVRGDDVDWTKGACWSWGPVSGIADERLAGPAEAD
jgi:hypothetical protein